LGTSTHDDAVRKKAREASEQDKQVRQWPYVLRAPNKIQKAKTETEEEEITAMNKLLTPQEVADLLSVRKSTIYQWTHQGYIPHVKLGKFVRFNQDKVMEWVEKKSFKGRMNRCIEVKSFGL